MENFHWLIFFKFFGIYIFPYCHFSSSHISVLLFFHLDIISTALLFVHADFHKQDQNKQNLCLKALNPHPIPVTHAACKATRKLREPIQKRCAAKINSKPTFSNEWNQISPGLQPEVKNAILSLKYLLYPCIKYLPWLCFAEHCI